MKPGWRTSEFWLATAAQVLGAVTASGALPGSGLVTTLVGVGAAVLAQLGYTASRTAVKKTHGEFFGTKPRVVK